MHENQNLELFNFSLAKVVHTLQLQNKILVKSSERTLIALLGVDYTTDIFTAAIVKLSAIDPDTFHWALENLPTLDSWNYLLKAAKSFALEKLMKKGFILGKHFSINCCGQILVHQEVKTLLMESVTFSDRLLLQKVLQVPEVAN